VTDEPRLQGFTAEVLRGVLDVVLPTRLAASPDGALLAVTAARRGDQCLPLEERRPRGLEWDMIGQHLGVLDGAELTRVLPDDEASWGGSWSPDGASLAFFAVTDGHPGIWVWDRATATSRSISTAQLDNYWYPLEWTASGDGLFVLVSTREEVREELAAPDGPQPDVMVLFSPRRVDAERAAVPVVTPRPVDVCVLDVATGSLSTLVTSLSAERAKASPDRRWLAVVGSGVRPVMDRFGTLRDVIIVDSATGALAHTMTGITSIGSGSAGPAWSPDSTRVAVNIDGYACVQEIGGELARLDGPGTLTDIGAWSLVWSASGEHLVGMDTWDETGRQIQGAEGPSRIWTMHPGSGSVTHLALPEGTGMPELFVQAGRDVFWSRSDETIVVLSRDPHTRRRVLHELPLDGSQGPVLDLAYDAMPDTGGLLPGICADVSADGERVFYRAENETVAPEIWELDRSLHATQLTRLNRAIPGLDLTPARFFEWSDEEGTAYRGALMLPPGHDGLSAVPIVVDTYPMPNWCDAMDQWEGTPLVYRQVLLAEGYGVFTPSVTALREKWPFARSTMDRFIVTGLDELERRGLADERVAVMGQSLGGYMVNAVITTTTRFKAAVSAVGISNLSSWFGQAFPRPGAEPVTHGVTGSRTMAGGAPFEHPDSHVEESPVFHLDKVETPLLVIHGDDDCGVTPSQGHEMFVGLRYLGQEVTQITYRGDGHGPMWYTEPNRTHFIEQVLSLFHRHLR